jgi:hypothetical protein
MQLVDDQGKPVALAPGGAWFVLVGIGTPLTTIASPVGQVAREVVDEAPEAAEMARPKP